MVSHSNFRSQTPKEKRLVLATKILERYPDRVPIICESATDGLELDKIKFLVPRELTVGQFMIVVKKRLKNLLDPKEALYFHVNNKIPTINQQLGDLWKSDKQDDDNLLYIGFTKENTFGY